MADYTQVNAMPNAAASLRLSTVPTSTASIGKARQLAHLQAELGTLQQAIGALNGHLRVTAEQAFFLKRLGAMQAGLFMGASRVLGEVAAPEQETEGAGVGP